MKKKIALLLGMLFAVALMLGACGTDPRTVDYNGQSYDDLKMGMQNYLYNVTTAMPAFLEQQGMDVSALEDPKTVKQLVSNYGVPENIIEPAINYKKLTEEYGECTNFTYSQDGTTPNTDPDDIGFTVDKAGKTLTTGVVLELENNNGKKKVDFQIVYNYNSMEVTGITLNVVQTMGEKISKAGLNTAISMGIVFIVLVLISLLIAAFKIFPWLEQRKKEQQKADRPVQETTAPAAETGSAAPPAAASAVATDDTELVAVIAAAIAAGTGTSTSDFVVRSIKRR